MDRILSPFRQKDGILRTVLLSNFFLSFHYFLIYYINSTFLSGYFSESQLSTLYIIGSIIDTTILLNASRIVNTIGRYKAAIYALVIECLATLGLAAASVPFLIGVYFTIHIVTISFLAFLFDMFVEAGSPDETETGTVRATYLTVTNVTVILGALVGSLLIHNTYAYLYLFSSLCIIPLYYSLRGLRTLPETQLSHIKIREMLLSYIRNKNLNYIFICQFLLQFFYAFMGIYTPLYLEKYIGFSWAEIGGIFTIMLLPFVLFELPVGEMADKKYGEKEFMTVGFVIMSISTLFMSFITVKSFFIWATVLFITRIGASFTEITAESFFFKHVKESDAETISFFRVTRPLSSIIAPIIATFTLAFIPYQYVFIVIGFIMVFGTRYALGLADTH